MAIVQSSYALPRSSIRWTRLADRPDRAASSSPDLPMRTRSRMILEPMDMVSGCGGFHLANRLLRADTFGLGRLAETMLPSR
jgi:hypothetical protein